LAHPDEGQNYSSGCLTTYGTFSQAYGYFACKARLPKGAGLWPAFWLVSDDQSWPPEIDVMENLGDARTIHTTYHWGTPANPQQDGTGTTTGVDYGADYHVFAVSWRPNLIVFLLDGAAVKTITGPSVTSKPMYMLVNDAVGGNWPGPPQASTPFPAEYQIAWVRAYQYDDAPVVPKTELVFGPTILSTLDAHPGDTLTAHSSVQVGAIALAQPHLTVSLYPFWGGTELPGSRSSMALEECPANQTSPITFSYTIPGGLAPGTYSIAYQIQDGASGVTQILALAGRIKVSALDSE
jgi:hypothetical protein